MTLKELVSRLSEIDESMTIYAKKPWRPESAALAALEPDAGGLPREAEDQALAYFLEIFLAREFLEQWVSSQEGEPDELKRTERLITYAERDA